MTLFAAVTNTGNVFCWLLIYLQVNSQWKDHIQAEVNSFLEMTASYPDAACLTDIPLDVLELHTQSIEHCTNETLRMLFKGTLMRRNIGTDIFVSNTRIKHGAFLMYPTSDLHYEPLLYPNPALFNPLRFSPEEVEARRKHGITFLGWGASRHVCVGKRVALLMIRMTMVLMMSKYHITIVDSEGRPLNTVPDSLNDRLFKVCQPNQTVWLKYHRTGSSSETHIAAC